MKNFAVYRVSASLIGEKIYSKIFHIDESNYANQNEIDDAIFNLASESWSNQNDCWELECAHNIDSVDFYEIVKA
ncbi:hypothetical protein [Polynucleobacter necessarius]|uniref:hypothetical protein n=1 Tax=Polynucleobacter necessarius TaxID=576610 RepID=UPI000E08DC6E|nr:hypothetical protein [Polynucleobacter necessarius]